MTTQKPRPMDPERPADLPHTQTAATAPFTVSAIIPTHNRRARLAAAIDSVLAQSLPVLELIIVDDGSTDGTAAWLAEHYPEVHVLQQSNRGVSHARNRAIEQTRGDWVALLDSDDRWYPDKLAQQATALLNNPGARWCHCDEHWLRNGKRVNPRHKHRKYGGDVFARCLPLCCISPSAVMIHRTVFDDRGVFDESLPACEDYDLWLRISAHESIVYVDKPLLEKTGGHADQLSQRYPAMDRFRLQSLARLLRSHTLSDAQQALALSTLQDKLTIVCNGTQKRGRHEEADTLRRQYRDLLVTAHIL